MSNLDLEGIHFEAYNRRNGPPEWLWGPLYGVHAQAFHDALQETRSPEEIDTYVRDPAHFRATTLNPQLMVGDRHNAGQEYHRPTLIVAYDGYQPVGFIRTASNVSGDSWPERLYKRVRVAKNYRAVPELAVSPAFQHRGVGLALIYGGFETAYKAQTGTGYIDAEELPKAAAMAEWLGGGDTGPSQPLHNYFGEGNKPVVLQRYAFTTAREAGRRMLENISGFRDAIEPHLPALQTRWLARLGVSADRDEFKFLNPHH